MRVLIQLVIRASAISRLIDWSVEEEKKLLSTVFDDRLFVSAIFRAKMSKTVAGLQLLQSKELLLLFVVYDSE